MQNGKSMNKTGTGIAAFIVLIGTVFPSLGHAQVVTAEMLLAELRSGDRLSIDRVLNEIKKEGSQGDVVFVVRDIWNKDKQKYPDINWRLIETHYIQLNIVDILIQASQHGTIDVDERLLHDFVLDSLNREDDQVVSLAVGILGFMGRDDDVDVILQVAKRFDESPFRVAVAELSIMCSKRAAIALDDLERQIEKEDRVLYMNYLRETRSRLQEYRDKKCK